MLRVAQLSNQQSRSGIQMCLIPQHLLCASESESEAGKMSSTHAPFCPVAIKDPAVVISQCWGANSLHPVRTPLYGLISQHLS